jgi:hypothetical protein
LESENDLMMSQMFGQDKDMVSSIGNGFVKKMRYINIYKTKPQLDECGEISDSEGKDPRIQYYLQCQRDRNSALPILDKIVNKTICLQNYTLSIGNCKGLALACENLNENLVNRIYLDNCGISGREFKEILAGLSNLKDCKSIVYY